MVWGSDHGARDTEHVRTGPGGHPNSSVMVRGGRGIGLNMALNTYTHLESKLKKE